MKEEINRRPDHPAGVDCRFKALFCLLLFCVSGIVAPAYSQCMRNNKMFQDGERVEFDLYFKWGLVMAKGGTAVMSTSASEYEGMQAWKNELLLHSSGMVDKVFRIRDTIINYTTREQPRLLFSTKRSDEGGYYQIDNLTYSYIGEETHVHAFRRNRRAVRVDTVLVGGNCVLDILGSLMHARSFDWDEMEQGKQYHLQVAMGKTVIPISYRYEGQRIVDRDKTKYSTRFFIVDIFDDAFTQSKEALEIWIGDDKNHLPVKVRAKLKIGAMEAYYNSSSGLRHPLTSRIEIPAR